MRNDDKPWKKPLREWKVVLHTGVPQEIEAHFCFDNSSQQDGQPGGQPGGQGLIFRRYHRGDDKSTVVAAFNRDAWSHYVEII